LDRLEEFLRTLVPCGILIPADSDVCRNNVTVAPGAAAGHFGIEEDQNQVFIDQAKTTLIAGCRFDELSWEIAGHGLLTKAFVKLINSSDFEISNLDLMTELRNSVSADFGHLIRPSLTSSDPQNQTPQLRGQGSRMDELFLAPFNASE
jgi:hypothetical protein